MSNVSAALSLRHSPLRPLTHQKNAAPPSKQYLGFFDSTCALVPKGGGQATRRLVEVLEAGAVPVLVADGLTLPFEPLVDWSHAAVWVEESATIAHMRANVAAIYARYFASPAKRADALLLSALAFARTRRPPYGDRPALCRDWPRESLLALMSRLETEQLAEATARCSTAKLL